jgi:hypothetical protein
MMGLKLRIASWTPQIFLIPQIDQVAEVTIECLDLLLKEYAPQKYHTLVKEELKMEGNLEERRKIMATAHNIRLRALIDSIGYKDAQKEGKKALFKTGLKLGREVKKSLGVGNSLQDLIRAARILYKVLGIEFKIEESEDNITMVVGKCSLSNYYTPETCNILSAADEGVVQGLNENIQMKFTLRITEGHSKCVACISHEN